MATFVNNGQTAVDPDPGVVIDRAETQDYSPGKGKTVEVTLIPAPGMKAAVADTARPGFRRKGYLNFQGPRLDLDRLRILARIVIAKTPDAVERSPIRALHLGT